VAALRSWIRSLGVPKSEEPKWIESDAEAEGRASGSSVRTERQLEWRRAVPKCRFYAVRKGRSPDLYFSWADCSREVTGFRGAGHRSFKSMSDSVKVLVDPFFGFLG